MAGWVAPARNFSFGKKTAKKQRSNTRPHRQWRSLTQRPMIPMITADGRMAYADPFGREIGGPGGFGSFGSAYFGGGGGIRHHDLRPQVRDLKDSITRLGGGVAWEEVLSKANEGRGLVSDGTDGKPIRYPPPPPLTGFYKSYMMTSTKTPEMIARDDAKIMGELIELGGEQLRQLQDARRRAAAAAAEAKRGRDREEAKRIVAGGGSLQSKAEKSGGRWLDFRAIVSATDNFDESGGRLLGKGGFGAVYRGRLKGQDVAVKSSMVRDEAEWLQEMKVMSSTKHRNLVGLLGVSGDHTHRILVLPLADGGDLNAAMGRGMSGNAMLQVLADASRGLSYMLHELPTAILHLDVKPGNILIDKGRGLIADFGLCVLESGLADKASFASSGRGAATAKLCKKSRVTLDKRGTQGYIDPELDLKAEYSMASLRSDVFSFGVVLCEAVEHACGLPLEKGLNGEPELAVEAVTEMRRDKRGRMKAMCNQYVELACQCIADLHDDRPWMDNVAGSLNSMLSAGGGGGHAAGTRDRHHRLAAEVPAAVAVASATGRRSSRGGGAAGGRRSSRGGGTERASTGRRSSRG